jgi:hypothetical protein
MGKKIKIKAPLPKNPIEDTFTMALSISVPSKEPAKDRESEEKEPKNEADTKGETITGLTD